MSLTELAFLYALVGIGCTFALIAARRRATSPLDAGLLTVFWPLYGPFILVQSAPHTQAESPSTHHLADSIRRAQRTPFGDLLPDPALAARLAERLDFAARKRDEIDHLLTLPDFSEADAETRREASLDRPDSRAAAVAHSRLSNIRRLRRMRDQFAMELDEIQSLITQLRVHAEVLRIAGVHGAEGQDLVDELIARVEGLDAVLDEPLCTDTGHETL